MDNIAEKDLEELRAEVELKKKLLSRHQQKVDNFKKSIDAKYKQFQNWNQYQANLEDMRTLAKSLLKTQEDIASADEQLKRVIGFEQEHESAMKEQFTRIKVLEQQQNELKNKIARINEEIERISMRENMKDEEKELEKQNVDIQINELQRTVNQMEQEMKENNSDYFNTVLQVAQVFESHGLLNHADENSI